MGLVRFYSSIKTTGLQVKQCWSEKSSTAFSIGTEALAIYSGESGSFTAKIPCSLPSGLYCDIMSGEKKGNICTGYGIVVSKGFATIKISVTVRVIVICKASLVISGEVNSSACAKSSSQSSAFAYAFASAEASAKACGRAISTTPAQPCTQSKPSPQSPTPPNANTGNKGSSSSSQASSAAKAEGNGGNGLKVTAEATAAASASVTGGGTASAQSAASATAST